MKPHLLKKFPQHVVPDELSLLSVYEIIMYLLILVGCWIVYRSWSKVPVVEHNITIEHLHSGDGNGLLADVQYDLPLSSVLPDKKASAKIHAEFSLDDNNLGLNDVFIIDSLKNVYLRHLPDSLTFHQDDELVYFRTDEPVTRKHRINNKSVNRDLLGHLQYGEARMENINGKQSILTEVYINGSSSLLPSLQYSMDIDSPALIRPSFWSWRDISQTYFKLNVNSHSLDSLRLRINFTGAMEFLPIGDILPVEISGNSVLFTIAPDDLISHNLSFFTSFKDLENNQARRIFFITSIIGALVTIFIAFIIIFLYRIVSSYSNLFKKKVKEEIKEISPQE